MVGGVREGILYAVLYPAGHEARRVWRGGVVVWCGGGWWWRYEVGRLRPVGFEPDLQVSFEFRRIPGRGVFLQLRLCLCARVEGGHPFPSRFQYPGNRIYHDVEGFPRSPNTSPHTVLGSEGKKCKKSELGVFLVFEEPRQHLGIRAEGASR